MVLMRQCFAQTLLSLEEYPLNGMVSPCLIASHGVVPLSIVSVIPDIIQVSSGITVVDRDIH